MTNLPSISQLWKRAAVALVVAALFWGCYRPIPTEEPLIPHERMVPIIKDVHLAESILVEVSDLRVKDSLARLYYQQIFVLHRIDSTEFEQSMNAYMGDPYALDSLYRDAVQLMGEERKKVAKPMVMPEPTDVD